MAIVMQRIADLSVSEIANQPTVLQGAEHLGRVYDFDKHPYFLWMREHTTSLEQFRSTQLPYRHAVENFSRALAAVLARITTLPQRLATLYENVAEEHGYGDFQRSHGGTFIEYLRAIGVPDTDLKGDCPPRVAVASEAFLNFCLVNPPEMGAAMLGIVEYTHLKVATLLAQNMHDRFWGEVDAQSHYLLHTQLDADHTLGLFAVCNDGWMYPPIRHKIAYSMTLGAQIWWTLFDALCPVQPIQPSRTSGIEWLRGVSGKSSTSVSTRRPYYRFACNLPVTLRLPMASTHHGKATEMSPCGVLVSFEENPPPIDANVEVILTFPDETLALAGRIRSSTHLGNRYSLGIEFSFISEAERRSVEDATTCLDPSPNSARWARR